MGDEVKPKKLLLYLVLIVAAVIAYQVGTFTVHYANVQSTLDTMIPNYSVWGQEEFKLKLRNECRLLGVEVHPANIKIVEDRLAKTVQVEFTYTRELQILFVSLDKTIRIRGYNKDLDI